MGPPGPLQLAEAGLRFPAGGNKELVCYFIKDLEVTPNPALYGLESIKGKVAQQMLFERKGRKSSMSNSKAAAAPNALNLLNSDAKEFL